MRFLNKIVVITGGTRGIGAAIGDYFVHQGANVILTGRNSEELCRLQSETKSNIRYVQLDLGKMESVSDFVLFLETLGTIKSRMVINIFN